MRKGAASPLDTIELDLELIPRVRYRPECVKTLRQIKVRAPTLNLKFIGTSADVDFGQMRDFQSRGEYLECSKTFLHSLGQKRPSGVYGIRCASEPSPVKLQTQEGYHADCALLSEA